ncbi:MAG: orotidine-5'-phosphate decarboxylase [Betaproteobacteria bacterium]|nr:MAG: orotidine-5'-phosphate decarboxylase [Betaproteobacteria bacterium]
MTNPRIVVALDYADAASALGLARQLDPSLCRVKVGKELFVSAGPAVVEALQQMGHSVFLDLKFHDIPHTVAQACAAAARLGVWMVNVHASGGLLMMQAARAALAAYERPPLLIAVTVLTSMGREDLAGIGLDVEPPAQVLRLARLAQGAGLDGVVCSAQEATVLAAELGAGFIKVTPGIRPAGSATGDQRRILTPTAALAAGADYLVIGRPITQADDPLAALQAIHAEISACVF